MPNPKRTPPTRLLPGLLAAILLLSWLTATATGLSRLYLPLVQRPADPFTPPVLDHLLITELMASPTAAQGSVEWIELYNPTSALVDLSGYKIGDEETIGGNEAMRQFPPGATITPQEVLVLATDAAAFQTAFGFLPDYEIINTGHPVPDLFDYVPWANGPFNFSNTGDELLLLDFFDNVVDSVAWGSSTWTEFTPPAVNPNTGSSLERFPAYLDTNTASDWRAQPQPQPGTVGVVPPTPTPEQPTATPTPFGGGLLLSEVVYDPSGQEPNAEWFELYNNTGTFLSLNNFKIGDEEASGESEGMYQFPPGQWLPHGNALVIANRASDFQIAYGFAPDFELVDTDPDVPDMLKYTTWTGGSISLTNGGDELLLLDYNDTVIDAVSWGASTWAFDPSVPLVAEDHSLERHPPYTDTDTAADWRDQPNPTPGTVDLSTPTPTPSPTLSPTPFGGGLLISEVVYDPSITEPNGEWFEIYNATGFSLNLTGFKIGDEETQGDSEGMYQFPVGSLLPADTALIIANRATAFQSVHGFAPDYELVDTDPNVPDMTKYTAWSNGSISLVNTGDELLILDYNDNLVDAVSWGSSTWAFTPSVPLVAQDHSLERVPANLDTNTAADWQDQPTPDPGNVNLTPPTPTPTHTPTLTPTLTPTPTPLPTPFTGNLLITEVLYDAPGTEPNGEWIEIYNFSGETLNLSTFKIGDEETQGNSEGMFQFPPGSTIADGQVVIVANRATAFQAIYGFLPDYELVDTDPTIPNMIVYSPWSSGSISLANTGDEVLLLDGGDNLVDAVSWGTSTWAFNPPVPGVAEGHSIERNPANVDTDTNADWVNQATPDPGNVSLLE